MHKMILLFACLVVLGCDVPKNKTVYEHGIKAAKSGVPANANPYQGSTNHKGKDWLDGWIDANKELR
jgi:ribosome modulation factor